MYRIVANSTTQYTTESTVRDRFARTNIIASLVIVVIVAIVAAFQPRTAMAEPPALLPEGVEMPWRAQVENNTMAIFALNADGQLHVYYFSQIIKSGVTRTPDLDVPFDIPTSVLETFGINAWISNPKICWTTTSGDQVCITY